MKNEMKVIFHIDELDKWDLTIQNIYNFINEIRYAKVICLANAEAVEMYKRNSGIERELFDLMGEDVKFVACRNALNKLKIDDADLFPGLDIVTAGVVELVKKQNEGYAYIKP